MMMQGLTYVKSTGHFIVIEEAVQDESHGIVPFAQEIKMNDKDGTYEVRQYGIEHGREREEEIRRETVYCSPAWGCGKGSLV